MDLGSEKGSDTKVKKGIAFIYSKIKGFKRDLEKMGDSFVKVSQEVHNVLQLSNFFLKDLEKLRVFNENYKRLKLVSCNL